MSSFGLLNKERKKEVSVSKQRKRKRFDNDVTDQETRRVSGERT